jgi:hypothetical protein
MGVKMVDDELDQKDMPDSWLKKQLPKNYINKWVFRGGLFGLVIFLFMIAAVNGFDFKGHPVVNCDLNDNIPCRNPFYTCKTIDTSSLTYVMSNCISLNKYNCEYNLCDKEYLQPGESIGKKELVTQGQMGLIAIIVLVVSFALNHLFWMLRKDKQ